MPSLFPFFRSRYVALFSFILASILYDLHSYAPLAFCTRAVGDECGKSTQDN